MRIDSPPAQVADRNEGVTRNFLSDVLDTLIAMRWDLNNALHDAALSDVPEVAIERMRRVKSELDLSIAAWKTLLDERGSTR